MIHKDHNETAQKLLVAAGEVFATSGYEAATIRQITDRAHVNLAAVNYYYGDKSNLYREVLRWVFQRRFENLRVRCGTGPADHRLRCYIEAMLLPHGVDDWPWQRAITIRALANEVLPPFRTEISNMVRPIHELLREIVNDMTHGALDELQLELATHNVQNMCLRWRNRARLIEALSPQLQTLDEQAIVEAIFQMASGGLQQLYRPRGTSARRRPRQQERNARIA
ncbi:MAG: TetR/AcrR family transcriptional regulator [Edaphobacter sp.]|uniref:TetR/AcrR family transcriptional regulator n=1 Tax=Edaphobacter sp. TaxID=1934404 RepID=UPI0023938F77|nr:TetR/AcrR family transcriptional regulator [Edaphobacter sp.]MDE1178709.1 TetR/AcrR family transcriptional regulator [Edaphobacter sp.]